AGDIAVLLPDQYAAVTLLGKAPRLRAFIGELREVLFQVQPRIQPGKSSTPISNIYVTVSRTEYARHLRLRQLLRGAGETGAVVQAVEGLVVQAHDVDAEVRAGPHVPFAVAEQAVGFVVEMQAQRSFVVAGGVQAEAVGRVTVAVQALVFHRHPDAAVDVCFYIIHLVVIGVTGVYEAVGAELVAGCMPGIEDVFATGGDPQTLLLVQEHFFRAGGNAQRGNALGIVEAAVNRFTVFTKHVQAVPAADPQSARGVFLYGAVHLP